MSLPGKPHEVELFSLAYARAGLPFDSVPVGLHSHKEIAPGCCRESAREKHGAFLRPGQSSCYNGAVMHMQGSVAGALASAKSASHGKNTQTSFELKRTLASKTSCCQRLPIDFFLSDLGAITPTRKGA